ncbi:hypothetical protein V6N13_118571 [Hibiscus sabdariffa]
MAGIGEKRRGEFRQSLSCSPRRSTAPIREWRPRLSSERDGGSNGSGGDGRRSAVRADRTEQRVLKQERKEYVIEEAVPNDPGPNAPRADKDKFKKHMDDMLDVGCLMLATMTPELQKQHEDMVAYEMIQNLKEIYEGQARQERYETSKALFQCKMSEGSPVGAHVIKMMGYIQTLEKLGFALNDELAIMLSCNRCLIALVNSY